MVIIIAWILPNMLRNFKIQENQRMKQVCFQKTLECPPNMLDGHKRYSQPLKKIKRDLEILGSKWYKLIKLLFLL